MAGRVAVPLIAFLLGLAAVGLSFLAYAKRIKFENIRTSEDGLCIYPSNTAAFGIGIVAALLILIQQILISVGNGCLCCGRNKLPCNFCGVVALILFVLSWLTFITAFTGLLATSILNNGHVLNNTSYSIGTRSGRTKADCLRGRESLFLGTAVWCIINLILNLISYATFTCAVRKHRRHHDGHFKGRDNYGA